MSRKSSDETGFNMTTAMKWTIWVQAVILVWSFTFNHIVLLLLDLASAVIVPFVWGVVDAAKDIKKEKQKVLKDPQDEASYER